MDKLLKGVAITPFIHLGLCYIYLYFYLSAFGERVIQLSSIQNVYSVGLGKVLPAYLIFTFSMFLAHLWNDKEPFLVVGRTDFERHPSLNNKWLNITILSLPIMAILGIIIQYYTERPMVLFSLLFITIPVFAYLQIKIFTKNNFPNIYRVPILMGFIGISQIALDAYGDGFRDRNKPYSYFTQDLVMCINGNKVLAPIGDNFLTVTKSGRRAITDIKCRELFHFPNRKIILDIV